MDSSIETRVIRHMDKSLKRLEKCEKKLAVLTDNLLPAITKRNDLLLRIEIIIISMEAMYRQKLRDEKK